LGNKNPLTLDPEDRLPVQKWQYVTVIFDTPDQDVDIKHRLNPVDAESVMYKVVRLSGPAVIYQDLAPGRKPWERTHIFLRASQPVGAVILLFLPNEEEELIGDLPDEIVDPCIGEFSTFHVEGQDDVVADQSCDTVTLVGDGITITTDPGSDTITFTNDCCGEGEDDDTVNCDDALVWTYDAQKSAPSAATGVSVTPSGSNWGNSDWVEVEDKILTDGWILTGISVIPGTTSVPFEVEVGTGTPGNQVSLGILRGYVGNTAAVGYLAYPIPIKGPVEGDRVWVRLRKGGTNTAAWFLAVTYYDLPIEGTVTATRQGAETHPQAAGGINVTSGGSAWVSGSWTVLANPTPLEWAVGAVNFQVPGQVDEWELDLGIGDGGSETVIHTVRSRKKDNTAVFPSGLYTVLVKPAIVVPVGSRLSARLRRNTGAGAYAVSIVYYQVPDAPAWVTEGVLTQVPAAASNLGLTSGVGTYGAWVQLWDAGAHGVRTIVTSTLAVDTTASTVLLEIGAGAAGAESVVGRINHDVPDALTGGNQDQVHVIGLDTPAQARVAVRAFSSVASQTMGFSCGYIEDPDFAQRSTGLSSVAQASGLSAAGAWANSAWVEVFTSSPAAFLVTGISHALQNTEYEVDLGTGDSGFEEVATTFRAWAGTNLGHVFVPLMIPLKIDSTQRVALRIRTSAAVAAQSVRVHYTVDDPPLFVCSTGTGGTGGGSDEPPTDLGPNFGIVHVDGQTDVESEVYNDVLNLAAGTGIAITTTPATDTVTIAASGLAPAGAEYVVAAAHADLTAERVATDTATIDVDAGTPAQMKWNVIDDSITFAKMQEIATQRVLGRNTAGTGNPEEITIQQVLNWISTTQGVILYHNGTNFVALAPGTLNQILGSGGAGANPQWIDRTETHLHGMQRVLGDGATTTFELLDIAEYVEHVGVNGSFVDPATFTLSADRTQIVFDVAPADGVVVTIEYVIANG
jgi:hypothetical protein